MTDSNKTLYLEFKDDVAAVIKPLFDLSEQLLRELGNFLPHGFVLGSEGQDTMVGAVEENASGTNTSTPVLPLLHDAVRRVVAERGGRAIGIAENVTITREHAKPTKAIKVLLEHRAGFCVAVYRPFKKRVLPGYEFGVPFTLAARPEVAPWFP